VVEVGPYTAFETPDPEWWCPRGYAHVRIDQRGLGKSPGAVSALTRQEAKDFYDAIEWAGTRSWCNGKVGLLGISIYAVNQWNVAPMRPPHLAAIIPWEGFTDLYRDFAYHGGVPADSFMDAWYHQRILGNTNEKTTNVEPLPQLLEDHVLDDEFYRRRRPALERIDVPLFAVANWGSHGLHLRGMFEGFRRAGSKHKWLRVHGNPKLGDYYGEEGRNLQLEFFDYWLKGKDNKVPQWPRIQLAVRHEDRNVWRSEESWPLQGTSWTPYYLDAIGHSMKREQPKRRGTASWEGAERDGEEGRLCFITPPFSRDVEITGPLAANLWVSSSGKDFDIFMAVRNLRPDGSEVLMLGEEGLGPVTLGWLRVSHRELDKIRSMPYQPYHSHKRRLPLSPGRVVPVNIEIWPTSMVFAKGHRLLLEIRSNDPEGLGDILHRHPLEEGRHTIHTGGEHVSHLVLPIVTGR
jgi:predicted acyl esterase